MKENQKNIVHDIRNSLGSIKGFASLLETDLEDRPNLKKMASNIVKSADKLNELLIDFEKEVNL